MKRPIKKGKKIVKGMPSAVVLSILIHAGLFLMAGMLVVFTVVKKEEQKFEPPRAVERPKMKLKKPKVKVKKTSKPKPTTRIVTKMNKASMPEIQLPEMSGLGDGLAGGIGGFDLMPDFGAVTIFGSGHSVGSDLVGTYYDWKLDRSGRVISRDIDGFAWRATLNEFLKRDWDTAVFSRYYRSPKKLYATNLIVPVIPSSNAPEAFGANESVGALWMVHYKGQLVHNEPITFRFWGMADEFMAVRVDGEMVLAMDWPHGSLDRAIVGNLWYSDSADTRKYYMGNNRSVVGDWITLEPGKPLPMEILIGDNGGVASFFLTVEVQGVEYEHNRQNGPILPAFKTTEMSHDLLDVIYNELHVGEASLTNGPVFRDYEIASRTVTADATVEPSSATEALPLGKFAGDKMRTWTFPNGRTIEAEYINTFSGKAFLKNAKGKVLKIPLDKLFAEDLEYTELANPPDLKIDFLKGLDQKIYSGGFYDVQSWQRYPDKRGFFGVRLKQTSAGEYNHELQVEMFSIGKQRKRVDAKYILLDRQKTAFTPSAESERTYEFRSPKLVVLDNYVEVNYKTEHGEKYSGYIVVVTDARGEMVTVKSSSQWLIDNLENLKKLSIGNYMDKTCTRTFPARPKPSRHY